MRTIHLSKLIIIVFIISWIGVTPSLLLAYEIPIPPALKSLEILMTLGPLLGACIFIYKAHGKNGLRSFFKRLLIIRTSQKTITVALFTPLVLVSLASIIGFSIAGDAWPESFGLGSIVSNSITLFIMYLILNTEELVWRGIVFDKLYDKYGYLKACLMIIPIWWLFHMPLFLYPNGHQAGYGLIEFTIIVIAQSFILGWIYIKSNRSLFYPHLHHQLMNGLGQAFPIFPVFIGGNMLPFWMFCGLMALLAIILVLAKFKSPKTGANIF